MRTLTRFLGPALTGLCVLVAMPCSAHAQGFNTREAPMLHGNTPATGAGWKFKPVFTVSEFVGAYQPPGILDGISAFAAGGNKVDVLVNHELSSGLGIPYALANGTLLTGARITRFQISPSDLSDSRVALRSAQLAYDTIYDRSSEQVVDPAQINETGNGIAGIARLCSSQGVAADTYRFVNDIHFAGEETRKPSHPHGGSMYALDVKNGDLWAAPALGRAAFENVTPLNTGAIGKVALLVGNDTPGAPLYLYVGQKNALGNQDFLDRNGLRFGRLYAWRADNGALDPEAFNGLNQSLAGTFVEVTVRDPAKANQPGYDSQGYADNDTLENEADSLGCFSFSRPEDVDTNPLNGTQAVLASTGRGSLFPSDNWGTIYTIDVDFTDLSAVLLIIHDADELPLPDNGIRNPDNLDWAKDGRIYVQENATTPLFGEASGTEASVWQLDPISRGFTRIAEIDRSAVAPLGSTDNCARSIGCWESSGILDVTDLFPTQTGERLLIATVQAHGIVNGLIGGGSLLVEGGQLLFLFK